MIRQSISINPISSTNNYQQWTSTSWCLASKLDSKFVSDHNIAKPIADAICKTRKGRTSYVKLTKAARRFQHIKFTTNCLLRMYSKDCDHNSPYVKYTYAQKHLTWNHWYIYLYIGNFHTQAENRLRQTSAPKGYAPEADFGSWALATKTLYDKPWIKLSEGHAPEADIHSWHLEQ